MALCLKDPLQKYPYMNIQSQVLTGQLSTRIVTKVQILNYFWSCAAASFDIIIASFNSYGVRGTTSGYPFPFIFFLIFDPVHCLSISPFMSLPCLSVFDWQQLYSCCLGKGGHPFLFGPPSSRDASAVVLASYFLYTYFGPPSSSQ